MKKIICGLVMLYCILFFTSCSYSEEELESRRQILTQGQTNAVQYLLDKYGIQATVKSAVLENEDTLFFLNAPATGYIKAEMLYDDKSINVYVNSDNNNIIGYDNYQSDEIIKDIEGIIEKYIDNDYISLNVNYGKDINDVNYRYMLDVMYDNNLSEILGKDYSSIRIAYDETSFENVDEEELANILNCDEIQLISFVNRDFAMNDIDLENNQLDEYALEINEYKIMTDSKTEYVKNKNYRTNEMILNTKLINLIEDTTDDASSWTTYQGFQIKNPVKISKSYSVNPIKEIETFQVSAFLDELDNAGSGTNYCFGIQFIDNMGIKKHTIFHTENKYNKYITSKINIKKGYTDIKIVVLKFEDLEQEYEEKNNGNREASD